MTFDEYQKLAQITAIYPNKGNNLAYPTLGLCGEAGEVAEKLKKIMRDKGGHIESNDVHDIAMELGDVLWYITAICFELGVPLETIAGMNIQKLSRRQSRGKLHGQGDNR